MIPFLSPRAVGLGAAAAGMAAKSPVVPPILAGIRAAVGSATTQAPSDSQYIINLLKNNSLNPAKSGPYAARLNALGYPRNLVSPSGKASLQDIAQKLYDAGRIKDNDEEEALNYLAGAKK